MRQAITTRYRGPTDHRGARITVSAQAGRRSYPWDDALDSDANQDAAALAFARAFGWATDAAELIGGGMPDGRGNVYVLRPDAKVPEESSPASPASNRRALRPGKVR